MRRILALAFIGVLGLGTAVSTAAAQPFPDEIPLPDGFQPEGIAVGQGDTFFVGSIPSGAIFSGNLRTGEGDILVPAQAGRMAIGLAVDARNRLFVAGGPTGAGYVYDASTGAELETYSFATSDTFVNDVVVTTTDAWFTDSFKPVLYRVPLSANGDLGTQADVETVELTGDFTFMPGFNVNGIEATPQGDALIVVQSGTGKLFTVDPQSGVATEIVLADGETVVNGDGILLHGRTLYVVQNQMNQVAAVRLSPDLSSGVVLSRTTGDSLDVPTTVAEFGNSLYLVNGRFGIANPDTAEYWISRLAKP